MSAATVSLAGDEVFGSGGPDEKLLAVDSVELSEPAGTVEIVTGLEGRAVFRSMFKVRVCGPVR